MYLFNKKINSSISKPVHIISASVILAIIIILVFSWSPASAILESVQTRLYSMSNYMNKLLVQTFSSTDSLRSQIDYYKNIAGQSIIDKAYLSKLENRISDLEDLLGYDQSVQYDTAVAKILSRSRTNEFTLLIDKGERDGIERGFAVVVGGGHLIGLIDSVSQYTSTVLLLEDPKTSIPVSIINSDLPSGLLIGEGGYLLKVQFIPQDRIINVGDIVVTTDLFEYVPNDLVIGVVAQIIEDDSSPFKEAVIEPIYKAIDYSDILIIKSGVIKIYEE